MSKVKAGTLATADDAYSVPTETLARGACRAWVNFDGTTTPPTIRASFNVSSVVRDSSGVYTVNFIEAISDTDYSVSATTGLGASASSNYAMGVDTGGSTATDPASLKTTTQVRVRGRSSGGSSINAVENNVAIHR